MSYFSRFTGFVTCLTQVHIPMNAEKRHSFLKNKELELDVQMSEAGMTQHHSVKLFDRPMCKCKWCANAGRRRDIDFGCSKCGIYLCRAGCFQDYHANYHWPYHRAHSDQLHASMNFINIRKKYMYICTLHVKLNRSSWRQSTT